MSCKDLETLKQTSIKSTKKSGRPSDFSRYVVSRTNFSVLNSHCYSMYLNRCKFEFSKDPRQFYNFVNAKRKSSALSSSVRLNSIEASTDPKIADLFAELFQSTYSSVSLPNSSYPKLANCIFSPVIAERSLLSDFENITL